MVLFLITLMLPQIFTARRGVKCVISVMNLWIVNCARDAGGEGEEETQERLLP